MTIESDVFFSQFGGIRVCHACHNLFACSLSSRRSSLISNKQSKTTRKTKKKKKKKKEKRLRTLSVQAPHLHIRLGEIFQVLLDYIWSFFCCCCCCCILVVLFNSTIQLFFSLYICIYIIEAYLMS